MRAQFVVGVRCLVVRPWWGLVSDWWCSGAVPAQERSWPGPGPGMRVRPPVSAAGGAGEDWVDPGGGVQDRVRAAP
ncbi:hypothetical protein CIB93_04330 [Streptomyces sp. WZ.A104]|nr:hypothetical protein CIB93_04330 [Streptomyces sp. WZ.A104]